jgi:hypothetical protein
MKKRAQVPDNHTYTIIFRGCASHPDSKAAVGKVLSIYHGMLLEKSPIKPNAIHMNALLKVCARADDMDALWSIAAKLPESGPNAPNSVTYTTIINALRMSANRVSRLREQPSTIQQKRLNQEASLKARQLWQDISERWSKGELWIDEELVCSMGRMLLQGEKQDLDDIFSLVEQAMNIPRPHPRLVYSPSIIEPDGREVIQEPAEQSFVTRMTLPAGNTGSNTDVDSPKSGSALHAVPGANTLSLIMDALLQLRLEDADAPVKKSALTYWQTFTNDRGVKADAANYHGLLRILRAVRASSDTVELLQLMPRQDMESKTFSIAIAACSRDKNNPNAFKNAGKILDLMQMALELPVISVLCTYMELAVVAPCFGTHTGQRGHRTIDKGAQGEQILRALQRLQPSFVNIRSLIAYGDPTSTKDMPPTQSREIQVSTYILAQKMVSALDICMSKALVPREMYGQLTGQRNKLISYMARREADPGRLSLGEKRFDKKAVRKFETSVRFDRKRNDELLRKEAEAALEKASSNPEDIDTRVAAEKALLEVSMEEYTDKRSKDRARLLQNTKRLVNTNIAAREAKREAWRQQAETLRKTMIRLDDSSEREEAKKAMREAEDEVKRLAKFKVPEFIV